MTAPESAASAAARPLKDNVIRTIALALPVMAARLGLILLVTVDSVMTGRYSAEALAHYGISTAPHIFLLVVGIGLLVGTIVLVGQADGAGRPEACGGIWRRSLLIAAVLGSVWAVVLMFGESILLLLGQSESMAAGGGAALTSFAVGMPALLMYVSTSFFLEGVGRARAGMLIALGANFVNGGLNWLLIGGNLGFPEMGAAGAALATSITRWVMLAALIGYVLSMADRARYGVGVADNLGFQTTMRLLRLGAPFSVATGLEAGAFATIATFAGRMGEVEMAAFQACMNVVSFAFMLAIGLSTATSVRVANAVGRNDRAGLAMSGWLGLALVLAMMFLAGLVVISLREPIAAIYTEEESVRALAQLGLFWVAAILMFDGAQAVLMGAHRGAADVMVPTGMQGFSFWVVAVPLAYLLGLHLNLGVPGLFAAIFAATAVAAVLLSGRFAVLSRRPVAALYGN